MKKYALFFSVVFILSVFWSRLALGQTPGTLKWEFHTGDWVESSPAIGTDGTIYVGSNDVSFMRSTLMGHQSGNS